MRFNELIEELYKTGRIDDTYWCLGYLAALYNHEIIELGLYNHTIDMVIDRNIPHES